MSACSPGVSTNKSRTKSIPLNFAELRTSKFPHSELLDTPIHITEHRLKKYLDRRRNFPTRRNCKTLTFLASEWYQ